jgi:hypothetical protein
MSQVTGPELLGGTHVQYLHFLFANGFFETGRIQLFSLLGLATAENDQQAEKAHQYFHTPKIVILQK